MSDLALQVVDGCIDLKLRSDGASLQRDDGLETAVIISIFTDQRVSTSELPVNEPNQRGWWADQFAENPGDQIGSKFWLIRGKVSNQTIVEAEGRIKRCLQWLIDDGVAESVSVSASFNDNNELNLSIEIVKPQNTENSVYEFIWNGQRLKRG